jgi:hypothetical protein
MAKTYADFLDELQYVFEKLGVEYMIIGGGSAVIQGFNMMTQDIDIYPLDSKMNNKKVLEALEILGFIFSDKEKDEILRGKDFIQFEEPFQIDLVFYPDGFNSYGEAKKYKIEKDGFPVMKIDGLIKSKKAANRPKDKMVLAALEDFSKFIKEGKMIEKSEYYFIVPKGYKVADNQTLYRWYKNSCKTLQEKIEKGIRG